MLNWISQNAQALNFFANIGTLIIWLVYAQLLYLGFRRQRHVHMVINRGKRKDINALCIISNMSKEPVYIEYIIAELETSEGTLTLDITDLDQAYNEGDEKSEQEQKTIPLSDNTRQGPLLSGEFLHIGSFSNVIKRLARQGEIAMEGQRPKGNLDFLSLKIQLICMYGPENSPFSAERSYDLSKQEPYDTLIPLSWDTKQSDSIFQRYRLKKRLAKLEESNFSSLESFKSKKY